MLVEERKERETEKGGGRKGDNKKGGKDKKILSGRTKGQNGACLISFKDFIHLFERGWEEREREADSL